MLLRQNDIKAYFYQVDQKMGMFDFSDKNPKILNHYTTIFDKSQNCEEVIHKWKAKSRSQIKKWHLWNSKCYA